MKYLMRIKNFFEHCATTWSMREWMVLTAAMLIIGLICMRGYGSRKNY
jgi:hypothetical protein